MRSLKFVVLSTVTAFNFLAIDNLAIGEEYEASTFEPFVIYQDEELIEALEGENSNIPTTTDATVAAEADDSDDDQTQEYAATYFEPVILFQDKTLIEELSKPEPTAPKANPSSIKAKDDPFGDQTAARPIGASESNQFPKPGLLIILAIALLIGTIWKSKVTKAQEEAISDDDMDANAEIAESDDDAEASESEDDEDDQVKDNADVVQLKTPN